MMLRHQYFILLAGPWSMMGSTEDCDSPACWLSVPFSASAAVGGMYPSGNGGGGGAAGNCRKEQ